MIFVVNADITIKSFKITPDSDPTASDDGTGSTCTGITVDVEFSEAPVVGSTVSVSLASNVGDDIKVTSDVASPTIRTVSGITLTEGKSLSNFKVSIDGTEIQLDQGVTPPTLNCLSDTASTSSESGVIGSSDASTDTAPKVTSFTISTPTAEAAINAGRLYCKDVKVDFVLDQTVEPKYLIPSYHNLPTLGGKATYLPDVSKPEYYFLLDVAPKGNLDDLVLTYNNSGSLIDLAHTPIAFTCTSPQTVTDPTTVSAVTSTTGASSTAGKDGVCNDVKIEFTLDNVVTTLTDLTVTSSSITTTNPTVTLKQDKTYTVTFSVKSGGNLDDLSIKYKGTALTSTGVSYSCKASTDTTDKNSSDDGSTSSTISINSFLIVCFTCFLILLNCN